MNFSQSKADVLVRGGESVEAVLGRLTHLCVAAHQDDIEIMAYAGISECLGQAKNAFGGVVVTDGAGSPRAGAYASLSDEQMQEVRRQEQRQAAEIGQYAAQIQLGHSSASVKRSGEAFVLKDLIQIFSLARPEILYLHQPADKHDTHVAVFSRCLEALRSLPRELRPARVLGCEVWRDLDWLLDSDKVALDASAHPDLALKLLRVFDSQIAGGKRYDLATIGRRSANATFYTSHATDRMTGITWAMDLTPLVESDTLTVTSFIDDRVERFRKDIRQRLERFGSWASPP